MKVSGSEISDKNRPTLFKDSDFVILTADAVKAILEVKTAIRGRARLEEVLGQVADDAEKVRETNPRLECGVFIYNNSALSDLVVLQALRRVADGNLARRINYLCIGPDRFTLFFPGLKKKEQPARWRSFAVPEMAASLFLSFVVWRLTGKMTAQAMMQWFPITDIPNMKQTAQLSFEKK